MWLSPGSERERGFSLVEVLVALSVAAIAMVVIFRAATQSTTASASVENHFAAAGLARSLLVAESQQQITEPFSRSGKAGELRYEIAAAIASGQAARLAPRGMAIYDLTVTVTWEPRGYYERSTLVLGQ